MLLSITDRELATVLAALRYWQLDLTELETDGPISELHFDSGNTPLTTDEIDELCERLNGDASESDGDSFTLQKAPEAS